MVTWASGTILKKHFDETRKQKRQHNTIGAISSMFQSVASVKIAKKVKRVTSPSLAKIKSDAAQPPFFVTLHPCLAAVAETLQNSAICVWRFFIRKAMCTSFFMLPPTHPYLLWLFGMLIGACHLWIRWQREATMNTLTRGKEDMQSYAPYLFRHKRS